MIFIGDNKNLKIEPYEPCPVHPENKFKFCCYKKAKEEPWNKLMDSRFTDGRVNFITQSHWESTDYHVCFGFDKNNCSGPIKSAHSIQNNRILNRISVGNHVYRFKANAKLDGVSAVLDKISKNKASTFFGFCDYHDSKIFGPIELEEYTGKDIQNFLFAFRSFSLEYHKKTRQLQNVTNIFEKQPRTMLNPEVVYLYKIAQLDVRDYEKDYEVLKSNYLDGRFNCFNTIFRQIDFEVPFAACATFTVENDLFGNRLNDIYNTSSDIKIATLHISVYPIDGKSNIIISHHKNDEVVYSRYFDQLQSLDQEHLLNYLNHLLIFSTENIYLSPSFIENLTEDQRESLEKSFAASFQPLQAIELIGEGKYFDFNLFVPHNT
jgi:hypothetical protein